MAHGIYVCIEHKRLMHGNRNMGIHSKKHHGVDYLDLFSEGIIIEIGTCENTIWNRCKDPHDRDATDQEMKDALRLREEWKKQWAKSPERNSKEK